MTPNLDPTDKKLLNLLQNEFPLTPAPFADLAGTLGITEDEVLERTRRLRQGGIIRHLSAIFDVYRVGYKSSLVAMIVPPERLDEAAAIVSAHPGVSHNYSRDHRFNLWFVMAIPREQDFEATVACMAEKAAASRTILLPALRLYKIDVRYDMEEGAGRSGGNGQGAGKRKRPRRDLTAEEVALVRVLQRELPIVARPFAEGARALGLAEEELLARARDMLEEGVMRRFAAVLRHQEAGFLANGMACWVVPEERVDEVGQVLAASPRVSHCYRRPTYPDWPYALFSMVHARSREQCEAIVADLSRHTSISDYAILYSTKEYKKERVQYFVEQADARREAPAA
jgi:DNA-binding Lrp family transcriptional regulator